MATKEELFWNEIESLCYAYNGMSPWDAYKLPVPVRKYFINTYNKRMEDLKAERDGAQDTSKPLSDAERMKFIRQSQQNQRDPSASKNMFKTTRNT